MNKDFTPYSKGCQLCQQGKWLCIFLTYQCTANCPFCPAPLKKDLIHSAFGDNKEQILEYLKANDFEGISFSGGDPFLVFDRMLEWLIYFKRHLPHFYFWSYTNGMLVDEEKMEQLALAGMHEIRFNIAATNYLSDEIWKKIKIARKYFSFVSIEVPSIKNDYFNLVNALDKIEESGVDFLNLHDHILTETEQEKMNGPVNEFVLNKISLLRYAGSSIENTFKLMEQARVKGYGFSINHCSMQQKEEQMLQRRLKMGFIFGNPEFDFVLEDGTIYNFYQLPEEYNEDNYQNNLLDVILNNVNYRIAKSDLKNYLQTQEKIIRVRYIPQMEVKQDKIILDAEELWGDGLSELKVFV